MSVLFSFILITISITTIFSFFLNNKGSVSIELFNPCSFLVDLPLIFLVDNISILFFFAVSLISSVVFFYRIFYIIERKKLILINNRFFFLLRLFVLSIILLVFSGSWLTTILGWDGLGLVSFLLVIFYNRRSSLNSGLLTVFINRVGDCFFIIRFMFFFRRGWLFIESRLLRPALFFIVLLFLGAITKRAQAPFSSWLPAAISAPTPVSSLVHSSTLVTAGVFVLIRLNFLITPIQYYITILSLITIVLAGIFAIIENDFKKVVAISTLRQIGFIVFSISLGYWEICFFHIIFHAFFKRSLFLTTGNLIHYVKGNQDSRIFGSIGYSFFSKIFFSVRCLRLRGFPFSLGFYSKDLLLGVLLREKIRVQAILFILGCVITISYSLRLIKIGFSKFPSIRSSFDFKDCLIFFSPLIVLYLFCIFIGNLFFTILPLPLLSFIDYSIGVILLGGGVLLLNLFYTQYNLIKKLLLIWFLNKLSVEILPSFIKKIKFSKEYTWSNILGGEGVIKFYNYLKKNNKIFNKIRFFPIILVWVIIFFYKY